MTFWSAFTKLSEKTPLLRKSEAMLYIDMDGVLTDFRRAALDLGIDDLKTVHPARLWGKIDAAGSVFWEKMPWMSDGRQLWNFAKKYGPSLLTAPSRAESSRIGKRAWVDHNLGQNVNMILAPKIHKHWYAAPHAILVDDTKENIDRWVSNGGIGILHTSAADTIRKLQLLLEG